MGVEVLRTRLRLGEGSALCRCRATDAITCLRKNALFPVLCENLIHWQRYKSASERRHFRDIALVRTTSGCS